MFLSIKSSEVRLCCYMYCLLAPILLGPPPLQAASRARTQAEARSALEFALAKRLLRWAMQTNRPATRRAPRQLRLKAAPSCKSFDVHILQTGMPGRPACACVRHDKTVPLRESHLSLAFFVVTFLFHACGAAEKKCRWYSRCSQRIYCMPGNGGKGRSYCSCYCSWSTPYFTASHSEN
jgi:hypothetical protein